jgi:hypothetical protein
MKARDECNKPPLLLSHSRDRAAVPIFRTGPVEQLDRANPIAGCSGYFDRISLALK